MNSRGASGLGAMDGLGAILFDTGCNVLNPGGPRLDSGLVDDSEHENGIIILIIVMIIIGSLIAISLSVYLIIVFYRERHVNKEDTKTSSGFVSQVVVSV